MATAPKQRVSDAARGVGLAGLIGVLTPVWAAHRGISRVRTAGTDGSTVDIPRVSIAERSLPEVMADDRPVILTDMIDRMRFRQRPDVDGLRRLAATYDRLYQGFVEAFRANRRIFQNLNA